MTSTPPAFAHDAASPIRYWPLVAAATVTLLVTMGIRQSLGLFVQPLARDTGLGIQTISFALAVGQFVWGAVQPVFGAVADSKGSGRVLVAGGLLLAAGMALMPVFASVVSLRRLSVSYVLLVAKLNPVTPGAWMALVGLPWASYS